MAIYFREVLAASRHLLSRESGRRDRLPQARIRRSMSTTYYALFHFLLEDCAERVVGTGSSLLRRRRIFMRVITHQGLRTTFDKVRGVNVQSDVADFFPGPVTPPFARETANMFRLAQNRRHKADYDLNALLSELDALTFLEDVEGAIALWDQATSAADRDFKHAICLLMVLKGKLRSDDG